MSRNGIWRWRLSHFVKSKESTWSRPDRQDCLVFYSFQIGSSEPWDWIGKVQLNQNKRERAPILLSLSTVTMTLSKGNIKRREQQPSPLSRKKPPTGQHHFFPAEVTTRSCGKICHMNWHGPNDPDLWGTGRTLPLPHMKNYLSNLICRLELSSWWRGDSDIYCPSATVATHN